MATRTGLSPAAKREAFKWFLLAKMVMLTLLIGMVGLFKGTIITTVAGAPWPAAGVAFFGTVVLVGLPSLTVGVLISLYGVKRGLDVGRAET